MWEGWGSRGKSIIFILALVFYHINISCVILIKKEILANKKGFSRTKFLLVMVQLNSQILQNSQNEFTHINKYFKSLISTRKNTKQQQTLYIETY